ncbi:hybrid sensor histidine kinase/response regulator [Alteromonas sediminis]
MCFLNKYLALFLFTFGFLLPMHASGQLQLLSDEETYSLAPHFSILEESGQPLSIEEILRQRTQFIPGRSHDPNFGFKDRAVWLHVSLDNLTNIEDWVVDVRASQNDYVDFYLLADQTVLAFSEQGKLQGHQRYRFPTFNIALPVDRPMDLYIRIQSTSSSLISPAFIQPAQSHLFTSQLDSIAWGLFYGGLTILAIYNLIIFFNVRHFSLVAYIGFVASALLLQVVWGGHIQLFFPQGVPVWLALHTELIFTLLGMTAGLFTLLFLETRTHAKRSHTLILCVLSLLVMVTAISLTSLLNEIVINVLVLLVCVIANFVYLGAGLEAYTNRFYAARYFLIAWILFSTGSVIASLTVLGVIPLTPYTMYCFQVGVFFQSGLFSVALMEKSRLQLETEVEVATNDLRNNMELIEEQNVRLDIARKDAIKASNIKSQFLANMSHEIRTPLNAILGFSRELEHNNITQEQLEQVRIINSAADNLLTIVNDVLDFSKIEAGKLQINNQAFSPITLFEEMVAIMAKSAHLKDLDFVFEPGLLPDKLIGDQTRLKQVLTNLIGNALKFTSSGYIGVRVDCIRRAHGVIDLTFDVTDTGIGISQQDRKKLFSAFSQVDDALNRNYQGTGLGLVISQELVRMMNGTITLKSKLGQGSTFSVVVRTSQVSQHSLVAAASQWQDKTVVVFDPFPVSRHATASMLCNLGANVYSCDSLEQLEATRCNPDFLLVFLPLNSRYATMTIMHCAMTVKAKQRVVWYSEHDPLLTSPLFENAFSQSLRTPATPSRLESILLDRLKPRPQKLLYTQRAFPNAKVLAVDDMSMNLMLLETWFKDSGVDITLAYSGEQAVELCQQQAFDIILMDVQMPNMDGLSASKLIRKTELNIGTPIIAVTAHAFKEEQDRLLASGMDDYLPKPISLEELIETMYRWCETDTPNTVSDHKVLDLDLASTRANNNAHTSKMMLQEFLSIIPDTVEVITSLHAKADHTNLLHEIHRLHGASCYTGAPEIQSLANQIEINLKKQEIEAANRLVPSLLDALNRFQQEGKQALEGMA